MSPVQRAASGFGVLAVLAALNFGWSFYLFAGPRSSFTGSQTSWRGVMGITPWHDPRVLALAFLLIGSLLLVRNYFANIVGLYFGLMTWCVLGASHAFFALSTWPQIIGFGGGVLGIFAAVSHWYVLKHRR